jgi:hypothetical protein
LPGYIILSWPSENVEISGKFRDWSPADASRRWGLELETMTACCIDININLRMDVRVRRKTKTM